MTVPEPPRDDGKAKVLKERQQLPQRIANALRATWRFPLIEAIVLGILIVAALVILRYTRPVTTTTFISRFQFTFPNVDRGRYPDGRRFTINEIVEPAILDQVYNQLQLNQFGIERNAFYTAFSIRPFALTEPEIVDMFRQQLADRRVLFAERERLEQQLRARLEQASHGAAELSFTLYGRLTLPPEVGRAVVQLVPRVWSQYAIENKGVLKIQGFSGVDNVIPKETIDKQPLPLAILTLIEANQRLDDRISEIGKTPGIWTVRDAVSGKSYRDLEWDIRELQLFHINPLRAALTTYGFPDYGGELRDILQQRISHLEILQAKATKQAEDIGESLTRFLDATAGLTRRATERHGTDQGVAGGTTIPQVGEGFIDRIIELTRARFYAEQNQAFITDRTDAQLELITRANGYRAEQDRWKELLAALPSESTTP